MPLDERLPEHFGFAHGLDSPEFLDVAVLQLAGLSAGACISVPISRQSEAVRPALRNLDGTMFHIQASLNAVKNLTDWATKQEQQLKSNGIRVDALRDNLSSAIRLLEQTFSSVGSETAARAQILQAMLYAITGCAAPIYTLHGSNVADSVNAVENRGISDLTSLGLSLLQDDLQRVRALRVVGAPGLFVSDRTPDPWLGRAIWVDQAAVAKAYRGEMALIGPARFLLADKLGRQLNVPWYLRPRQLSSLPVSEHDIPLTQVSLPFWCRWSSELLPRENIRDLPGYSIWDMEPTHVLNALVGERATDFSMNGRRVLSVLDRWMYGRRHGYSDIRFLDATREILSKIGQESLHEAATILGVFAAPIADSGGGPKSSRSIRAYCSLVAALTVKMLEIGQLSVPRAFAMLTKHDLCKLTDRHFAPKAEGKVFPTVHLRVFAESL